jgi:hypothetical protein
MHNHTEVIAAHRLASGMEDRDGRYYSSIITARYASARTFLVGALSDNIVKHAAKRLRLFLEMSVLFPYECYRTAMPLLPIAERVGTVLGWCYLFSSHRRNTIWGLWTL